MVKKRILFILLGLMLAVSVGLIGCGGGGQQEEEEEGPTEVLLGATLPETGIFAGFGQQGWGMQKAIDDWNDEYGGMYLSKWDKTVPIRDLIIKNNESDGAKVGPLTTDLVLTEGVHALLSPDAPCDLHDPTSVVANQYGIPQVIPGGPFEPWYHGAAHEGEEWPYTWFAGFAIGTPAPAPRNKPGYTLIDTWLMYMDRVDAAANTNMIAGIFANSDADGIGWYPNFLGVMRDYGMTVVGGDEELGLFSDDPTQDFTSLIQRWQDEGVEIIWGNCPGAHFQRLWSQCYELQFRPKICMVGRAALFPLDVISWGTTPPLGWGVGTEVWWSSHYAVADDFVGIGGRTAASLADDWAEETGEPLNRGIGHGYLAAQVMLDAIHRAGDVDPDAINDALEDTELDTISGWVKFDTETHFSHMPLSFGQWFYDAENEDEPFTLYITCSALDFIPEERAEIFPVNTLYS